MIVKRKKTKDEVFVMLSYHHQSDLHDLHVYHFSYALASGYFQIVWKDMFFIFFYKHNRITDIESGRFRRKNWFVVEILSRFGVCKEGVWFLMFFKKITISFESAKFKNYDQNVAIKKCKKNKFDKPL